MTNTILNIGDVVVLKSTMELNINNDKMTIVDTEIRNNGKGYPRMTIVDTEVKNNGKLCIQCVWFNTHIGSNSIGTFIYDYFSPNALKLYVK